MKKVVFPLVLAMIFLISLIGAQTQTYSYNFICMDSADGNVFWGIIDSTDVKLLKFTLETGAIAISETIDLPDTLIYKQVVVFNEQRVGISTETNTYVYYDGYINHDNPGYYTLYAPIQQIKRNDSTYMYVLFSSGVIASTSYNFQWGNQFCSQSNSVDNISCFDICLESPLQLVCGGYEVFDNDDTAAQLSIFVELDYYSVPNISYGYGEYSEISNVINDESGIYIIAKESIVSHGIGAFNLIKINQNTNFSQEILVRVLTHFFAPMSLIKDGNFIYLSMGTSVARYNLNTTDIGWQSVLSTSYGDNAKSIFIAGNKLIALFEHSNYYGYFTVLDLQSLVAEDGLILPEIIVSNYPNPFKQQTTINFDISKTEKVSLQVFNIKGQLVRTLVDETKSVGNYQVIWNGTDQNGQSVSRGIYFYKVTCGKFSSTKKMIMMK